MASNFRGRPQAPKLADPLPIRSAPIGGSTYVRAGQVSGAGRNMADLADALSGLNRSLERWGASHLARQQEESQKSQEGYIARLSGKSTDEVVQLIQGGEVPEAYRDGVRANIGFRKSEEFQQEVQQAIADGEFDPIEGNMQDFLRERAGTYLGEMDDITATAFAKSVEPFINDTVGKSLNSQVEYQQSQMNNGYVAQFNAIIKAGRSEGVGDDVLSDQIIKAAQAWVKTKNLDPRQANDLLVSYSRKLAEEGEASVVEGILKHDRNGLGSIYNTAQFGKTSVDIIEHGQNQRRSRDFDQTLMPFVDLSTKASNGELSTTSLNAYENEFGELDPTKRKQLMLTNAKAKERVAELKAKAAAKQVIKDTQSKARNDAITEGYISWQAGSWHQMNGYDTVDDNGEYKFIDPETQRNEAKQHILKSIQDNPELSEEDKYQAQLDFAADTGEIVDAFKQTFDTSYVATRPETLTKTDGTLPDSVSDGLGLYLDMYARDRKMLAKHMPGKEVQDFYEAARIFKMSGMDDKQAMSQAFNVVNTTSFSDPLTRAEYKTTKEIGDEIQRLNSGWGTWFKSFVGAEEYSDAENYNTIAVVARDMVNMYIRAGRNPDTAIKEAIERIDANYEMVNGHLVFTADKNLPPDFRDLVNGKIDMYLEAYGDEEDIDDPKDITIVPWGNTSNFILWNVNTGAPVESFADRNITLRSLGILRQELVTRQNNKIIDEQARKQKRMELQEAERQRYRDVNKGVEERLLRP